MKLHAVLAPLGLALVAPATSQLSINTTLSGTFVDISATGTPLSLSDDGEIDIVTTTGNALLPAGVVRVGSNGAVRFHGGGQSLGFTNGTIPSTGAFAGDQTLMPFWDDIDTDSGLYGDIYWQETGGMLVIQWEAAAFYNGSPTSDTTTFQIQVPSSGSTWARYVYADVMQPRAGGGVGATIGYQAGNWGNDVTFSFDTSGAVSDLDVLSLVGTFTPPMPPANDDCTNAAMAVLGANAYDSNLAAMSTPAFSCNATGSADVWFMYTATSTDNLRVETCGSPLDTVLEIYSGSCGALVSVDCGDNECGLQSIVDATGVSVGTDYFIRVGSTTGADGTGTVTITEIVPPIPLTIVDNIPGAWVDISSSGVALSLSDDDAADIATTIGNSVLAAGTARVGSNGAIRFGGTGFTLGYINTTIPSTNAFFGDQTLMPFWDDINTVSGTVGEIYYQEIGGVLVVQWELVGFFSSVDTVTFQVQVFPAGAAAVAQFLYQDVSSLRADGGGSATIGYQDGGVGYDNFEWSFDTSGSVADGDVLSIVVGPGTIGTNYCAANANSTGVPGAMFGVGSAAASNNDLTLTAADLPMNSFAFFLSSTVQGFVPNPGGSAGNLCMSGAIGRYVGPGQIQNAGTVGEVSLLLDLTMTPTPVGFVSIQPGQTWNFQCWYRDMAVGGGATSNFTDGLEVLFF